MAVQDLLSQDEIDALLHGVDDGLVDTDDEAVPGSIKQYDLTSKIVLCVGVCDTRDDQ